MSRDTKSIAIGTRRVGPGAPLFVIAEIGLNHGGSLERALALVDAAASAGASAVKLQTLVAAELVAPSPTRDFFAAFELDEAAHHTIAARARARGLAFLSTPLSLGAVDMLERVGVDAYKVASGDITFVQLIDRCARTGAPILISSGASTLDEVARALDTAQRGGAAGAAVLHCVSAYPLPQGSENLRAIATMVQAFPVPVGLSDHGSDTSAVPIAVACGASLYERHVVLAKDDGSVDAAVSSTPDELTEVVRVAARAALSLGTGVKVCRPAEAGSMVNRRGLYAARPLREGHVLAAGDVIALRPASALTPDRLRELIGVTLTRHVDQGTPFHLTDLEGAGGVA
jgi:sialic acid synthase SpsE